MTEAQPATISTQQANPHRIWQTIALYLAFIILGLVTASYGPALPYLASQTNSPLDQISLIFTSSFFGYMLGSLFAGRLYDRQKAHPLLILILLVIAAGMALMPFIPQLVPMVFLFFVLGLVTGSVDVAGNTLLIWAHGKSVGPFMNGLHFFYGVGAFLAPLLVSAAVSSTGTYSRAYWIIAICILPVALLFSRVASPVNPASTQVAEEKPFNRKLVLLMILFLFLYVGAESSFGGWVFTYGIQMKLADENTAAFITSAFWLALTAGRLLGVPVSTWLQPKPILWIDLFGCLVSLILLVLFPASPLVFWIGSILLGLSMASIFPTAFTLAEKRLHMSGKLTSWFFVGVSLGGMSLPWVIGQIFVPLGPLSAIWLLLVDVVLSIIVFFFI
jgi:MFS transporter, FHS family, Na+ dependent glucose transporter 1